MKKIVSVIFSFLLFFSIATTGYAAESNTSEKIPNIIIENQTLNYRRIDEPSKAVRTPDVNRTYYTLDNVMYAYYERYGERILAFTMTTRYIWSVETLNPTASTLALDSIKTIDTTIHASTVYYNYAPVIHWGNLSPMGYWYPYVTVFLATADGGITISEDAQLYPDGRAVFVYHDSNTEWDELLQ